MRRIAIYIISNAQFLSPVPGIAAPVDISKEDEIYHLPSHGIQLLLYLIAECLSKYDEK